MTELVPIHIWMAQMCQPKTAASDPPGILDFSSQELQATHQIARSSRSWDSKLLVGPDVANDDPTLFLICHKNRNAPKRLQNAFSLYINTATICVFGLERRNFHVRGGFAPGKVSKLGSAQHSWLTIILKQLCAKLHRLTFCLALEAFLLGFFSSSSSEPAWRSTDGC